MISVAFTGPSRLTLEQAHSAAARIGRLPTFMGGDPAVCVTGGAPGLDVLAARNCLTLWPLADHVIVVPAAPYAEAEVAGLVERGCKVIEAPKRATASEAYRARNHLLVALAQAETDADDGYLAAFLKSDRFYRSGEWMTVNLSRGHLGLLPFILP